MKWSPSNLKFKKYHKPNSSFLVLKNQKFFFPKNGFIALKALDSGKLNFRHIESGRRAIRRTTKKFSSIFINIFPYASITKKPISSRMGKGKGSHAGWICPIRKGQIIYELAGPNLYILEKALIQAGSKLPLRTKIVSLVY